MKRVYMIFLAAAVCLGCAGCRWMDGSYVSVTPHQVGYVQTPDDNPTVSNFAGLRSALISLIDSGAEEGIFYLDDYSQEAVTDDMATAMAYACQSYPIGAYAVESIDYAFGTSGGQNALSVRIDYRHTSSEIARIQTVRGISGAKRALADALASCRDSLVLQVTGFQETDFVQLVEDYAAGHPDVVMELPQTSVQIYPDRGDVRIVELIFSYQTSRESLRQMQNQVEPIFSSAAQYVIPDAEPRTKYSQLYNFLMERFDYTMETSITPAYSLLRHGVGDSKAFAQVYAAMCSQAGLECITVSGACDGESRVWNIILDGDVYYHLDLLQGSFSPRSDAEMTGYVWDYSAYPACGAPDAEDTEPTEDPA